MQFYIMTLFPEMVMGGLKTSIIGRAIKNELLSIEAINIRDYAFNKHNSVDDYPYGGGAGMLMQAEPVYQCYKALEDRIGKRPRVVYLSPQGQTFNQKMAEEFAEEEELVFLCGHYEGIDERVLEEIVTDYVSIGDYVLTGGELPALTDCILGTVSGSLGETSALLLLLGGIYLIARGIIDWVLPVSYIAVVFVLAYLFGHDGLYEIMNGGLMLGAFFMATDYTTSPMTRKGRLVMGIGCGLLTAIIRAYGGYPEGVSFSILLMNICVPLIDRVTMPKIYGEVKSR